jgi:hypothetical protein
MVESILITLLILLLVLAIVKWALPQAGVPGNIVNLICIIIIVIAVFKIIASLGYSF